MRGLVLANLGTPAAPSTDAVRAYLREFLTDRRVVQIPPLLWKPLLDFVILPRRSPVVAEKYAEIWMDEGSPLLAHTTRLAAAVAARMPGWKVLPAMRYGQPALGAAIEKLHGEGIRDITVLPLYPQYSTTTTASVEDVVDAARARLPGARIETVRDYHDDPGWVAAVAGSIRAHWAAYGRGEKLLLSFHGIPERLVKGGDPYAAQCEAGTRAIAAALGLGREEIVLTYQSRFGRERWLQPYTLATVERLGREGVRRLDVVCPGFSVDCLETLEEIAMQNADAFRAAGGGEFRYVACLNDSSAHAEALAEIVRAGGIPGRSVSDTSENHA
ncbi:ferrochelatase [Lysobacter pythonis]|uniref:Ferrochelatase n=1 Tax=Solilutibacter pythonis TaxID=2483112 RepID=A0A3M2HI88_9GAMM|nr:ferrochelatase [Lysobacter pythonis]RMH88105.1 ferrochelatase [Lysobacter pythonis]